LADTKISALTPITPVVGTQLIPISTVGLLNGSITPAGILSYGTSPVTGTTITATTQLVGAKVSESVTAGAGWTITAGTATTAVNGLSITQTLNSGAAAGNALNIAHIWNTNAAAITAIKLDVTNASSHAASNFADFQVGGVSQLAIRRDITVDYGSSAGFFWGDGSYMASRAGYGMYFYAGAAALSTIIYSGMYMASTGFVGWTSGAVSSSADTGLSRISAGITGVGTGSPGSFAGGLKLTNLTINRAATFLSTSLALTNGAGASAGTITNAPAVGNPTKWIGIDDNGTTRYIPAW